MGRRREEEVDKELLAQLMSADGSRIRVPLPKRKVNEMFAIADQMLGGRRVHAVCEDGETRLARIPGKMRRRQWVREGDLIVLQPWDFQDSKADVKKRYTKTQALYLSRKGVLPAVVDIFGAGEDTVDISDDSGLFAPSSPSEQIEESQPVDASKAAESEAAAVEEASADGEEAVEEPAAEQPEEGSVEPADAEEPDAEASEQSEPEDAEKEEGEDIDSFFS